MYGSGEIVATVNDYLFTNWAFVIKCVGGVYYQFSRPVKIAFLKPRRGWSLSREEPQSVFLVAKAQEGEGRLSWGLLVRTFVHARGSVCVCVCVLHWERHPLRPLTPAGLAVTEPRSIFFTPTNWETCKDVCVGVCKSVCLWKKIKINKRKRETSIHMKILYTYKYTHLVLRAKINKQIYKIK